MKYNFKKKLTAVLSATLAAVLFVSAPASALEWSGSAGGGTGGGDVATNNNYTVADTSNTACGYRFTLVDYTGDERVDSIDVACSSYHNVSNAQWAYRFARRKGKIYLKNHMSDNTIWRTEECWINTDTNFIGVTLPTDTRKIQATVMVYENFDKICQALGLSNGADDLKNGDKILVEPLFAMTLKGQRHVLTVTELGIWGGAEFGWDKGNKSTSVSGSYGFIANYTNCCWPSGLYNTDTTFWYAGWDAWGDGNNTWQRLLTFRQMVEGGFGVAFAYDNKENPIPTVNVYPTGVTFWNQSEWGNEIPSDSLTEGETYWPRFTYYNDGEKEVKVHIRAWDYTHNHYAYGGDDGFVDVTIPAYSEYTYNGAYPITINKDLYMGYDYQKFSYYDYDENLLCFSSQIGIIDDSVVDGNGDDDINKYSYHFYPKTPSAMLDLNDKENKNSSWIQQAIMNGVLFSGEEVQGTAVYKNMSSFDIKTNSTFIGKIKETLEEIFNIFKSNDSYCASGNQFVHSSNGFRVKNTSKNDTKNLNLYAAAGEKSIMATKGESLENRITKIFNEEYFFENKTENGVTQEWDNENRILTLNGTFENTGDNTGFGFPFKVYRGDRYEMTYTYIGGSITGGNNVEIGLDVYKENRSDVMQNRNFKAMSLPGYNGVANSEHCILTVNNDGNDGNGLIFRTYSSGDGTATFNNYKVKIELKKIENVNSDSKTYTILPTDVETESIGLYDADTNELISENEKLKSGRRVYTKTVYKNNTETSVPVTINTNNNNGDISYNLIGKETEISNKDTKFSVKFLNSEPAKNKGISIDNETQTLTINNKTEGISGYESQISENIPINIQKGKTYEIKLTKINGSVVSAAGADNGSSVVLDFVKKSDDYNRHYIDARLPGLNGMNDTVTYTLTATEYDVISKENAAKLTLYISDKDVLYFDNYQIKIEVREISEKEEYEIEDCNDKTFFKNTTQNGVTQQWDNNSRILTLNGDFTGGDITDMYGFCIPVYNGDKFRIDLTYISGTAETEKENYACVALDAAWGCLDWLKTDTTNARIYGDASLPCVAGVTAKTTSRVLTVDIPNKEGWMTNNLSGLVCHLYADRNITFRDYKVKVEITKLTKKELPGDECYEVSTLTSDKTKSQNSFVLGAKQSVMLTSDVFEVSAVKDNNLTVTGSIYLKSMFESKNTEYEYNEENNEKSVKYIIETPFKPSVIQANSNYRRGITVITSFEIINDSLRDFGTTKDISVSGPLKARLLIYDNEEMEGTPIADIYCDYCVPKNGEKTLVWFEWKVPTGSPDNLYAKMLCDSENNYSSATFVDNGNNSKSVNVKFSVVTPEVLNTPDTTFAKRSPYWFDISNISKPSDSGLDYYGGTDHSETLSWSYYLAENDNLVKKTDTATLMGAAVNLIPDGTDSAFVDFSFTWSIKSGYGFKIETEFKENKNSTYPQSGYMLFPEFLKGMATSDKEDEFGRYVENYTNTSLNRVGFKSVNGKRPVGGGKYGTYATLDFLDNSLVLPINDSSHTETHFIPIWYPDSTYYTTCYIADAWTPGGMLSKRITSTPLHIKGSMYDDYIICMGK